MGGKREKEIKEERKKERSKKKKKIHFPSISRRREKTHRAAALFFASLAVSLSPTPRATQEDIKAVNLRGSVEKKRVFSMADNASELATAAAATATTRTTRTPLAGSAL